jgi:hypothetical protein
MNATLSAAQRQLLPAVAVADRLLHILRALDHLVRWDSGYMFWMLAMFAQQCTLARKTSELTGLGQDNCHSSLAHIADGAFKRKWREPGFPVRRPIIRYGHLTKRLLKQLAGVRTA